MDPGDTKKRANRKLLRALLIMTAGSFAFGWALVPLYDVLCRAAGIGNAQVRLGDEMLDWGRETFGVTMNEFYGQTEANLLTGNSGRISSAW